MLAPSLGNPKLLIPGVATLVFAAGYGLLLADIFVSEVDGWDEFAAVVMGGALLLTMMAGVWSLIELQRFLGRVE